MTDPLHVPPAALAAALGTFADRRVLVVGDVMLDRMVSGTAQRMSPEAPVPVLWADRELVGLGGAANVTHQVRAFGAAATLGGVIGADPAGEQVVRLCSEASIGSELVVDPSRPTTQKARYIANEQYVLRVDTERPAPLDGAIEAELLDRLAAVSRPDVVVLSDHDKGVLGPRLVRHLIDAARHWGVPVLVDPKTEDLDRLQGAAVIKANQREFEALAGVALGADPCATVAAAWERIASTTGCAGLVVTLGGAGMVVATDGALLELPAVTAHPADVSGAGDTVIATLALGLASGLALDDAARVATVAAGMAVARSGVSVIEVRELAARLDGERRSHVHDRAELLGRVALWRLAGRPVVLANGCFDLFHAGHLSLLRAAAADGAALIVAIDTDESVRSLKGPDRPVVPADQRAAIVGAVAEVDAVAFFHHRELADLVAAISPDRLVKGADYAGRVVVGQDLVEARGGSVVLAPLDADATSTSAIIERLRRGPDVAP